MAHHSRRDQVRPSYSTQASRSIPRHATLPSVQPSHATQPTHQFYSTQNRTPLMHSILSPPTRPRQDLEYSHYYHTNPQGGSQYSQSHVERPFGARVESLPFGFGQEQARSQLHSTGSQGGFQYTQTPIKLSLGSRAESQPVRPAQSYSTGRDTRLTAPSDFNHSTRTRDSILVTGERTQRKRMQEFQSPSRGPTLAERRRRHIPRLDLRRATAAAVSAHEAGSRRKFPAILYNGPIDPTASLASKHSRRRSISLPGSQVTSSNSQLMTQRGGLPPGALFDDIRSSNSQSTYCNPQLRAPTQAVPLMDLSRNVHLSGSQSTYSHPQLRAKGGGAPSSDSFNNTHLSGPSVPGAYGNSQLAGRGGSVLSREFFDDTRSLVSRDSYSDSQVTDQAGAPTGVVKEIFDEIHYRAAMWRPDYRLRLYP